MCRVRIGRDCNAAAAPLDDPAGDGQAQTRHSLEYPVRSCPTMACNSASRLRELSIIELGSNPSLTASPQRNAVPRPVDFAAEIPTIQDQVLMARRTMGSQGRIVWFTASAFMIPLKDGAVDGTICNRLMHHLPSGAEQERLIHELLRVSV